jgi:hypothetical protein
LSDFIVKKNKTYHPRYMEVQKERALTMTQVPAGEACKAQTRVARKAQSTGVVANG